MMEDHQLIAFQGHSGVRPAIIISKLDLEDIRSKDFHNCTDLAAAQAVLWRILY